MNGIALRLVLAVSWLVWVVGMLVVTVPVESQRKLLVGQQPRQQQRRRPQLWCPLNGHSMSICRRVGLRYCV
ncbi:MAG: hypothetical protein HC893_08045 [Chloroflexaceae bacterium]|nr:hypothetical protein [Chloroflexaceae bacterium]